MGPAMEDSSGLTEVVGEKFCPRCGGRFPASVSQCSADSTLLLPVGTGSDISGTTLKGKYLLIELLGSGSFGQVYRAMHLLARAEVAVKIMHEDLQDDPKIRRQFLKEAQAVMRLHSRHTVVVHDVDEDEKGRLFIVMELLKGISLEAWVKTVAPSDGRIAWEEVVRLALQICEALDEAHENGVIHRDLKPANVMIQPGRDGKPHVKVVDFGIARLAAAADLETMTTQSMPRIIGTPAYMSPEQCRGLPVDGRADLYGLGIIMYELLTGYRPFSSRTTQGLMLAHVTDPVMPLSQKAPDLVIPSVLERAVMGLLEKDPMKRPQSAAILMEMLRPLLEETPKKKKKSLWSYILVAGVVVLLAGVAMAVYLFVPSDTSEPVVETQPLRPPEPVVTSTLEPPTPPIVPPQETNSSEPKQFSGRVLPVNSEASGKPPSSVEMRSKPAAPAKTSERSQPKPVVSPQPVEVSGTKTEKSIETSAPISSPQTVGSRSDKPARGATEPEPPREPPKRPSERKSLEDKVRDNAESAFDEL